MPIPARRRLASTVLVAVALVLGLAIVAGPPRSAPSPAAASSSTGLTHVATAPPIEATAPAKVERLDLGDHGRWLPLLLAVLVGLATASWLDADTRSSAAARLRWQRRTTRFRRGPPAPALT